MPPDSVAKRFGSALNYIGLTRERTGSRGDTAWAEAGPTMLVNDEAGMNAARVVAVRFADSTHFRVFVAADSIAEGRLISVCAELMSRASIHPVVPREQEADDSAAQWRRR